MTYLYRHFDIDNNLLYVGITLYAKKRIQEHERNSHWFEKVSKITLEKVSSRKEALELEKIAIQNEKPLCNLQRPPITIKQQINDDSKNELVKRLVQFNPMYTMHDVGNILQSGEKQVREWVNDGKMGSVIVGSTKTKYGHKPKVRITGWQLIEFIEYLENIKEEA
jgi:predicted GIY-YIG superfamily endonuclease